MGEEEKVVLRHTAAQVDDGIDKANAAAPKSTVYTKAEVDLSLATKADSVDVYDKDAVDELLDGKVDVESGKGLSTNDYTNAEKTKLANLENYDDTEVKTSIASVRNTAEETAQEVEDARGTYTSLGERLDDMGGGGGGGTSNYNQLSNKPSINGVTLAGNMATSDLGIVENVQADWNETDSTAPSYIQNKPVIPSGVVVDTTYNSASENAQAGTAVAQAISTKVDKVTGKGLSENDYTNADKTKLDGIDAGAEANVQSDWAQTDDTADDYIKNKPVIPAAQVNADWDAVSGVSQILNKPTIPTVNDGVLTIQKNGTSVGTFSANAATGATINITVPVDADDVSALPDTTKYGASLSLSINSTTYVVTASLKDQDGNTLGTTQTIDLPLETVVVGGSYDDTTKKVILTLKNGATIDFSVADLVAGLQTEITSTNKLSADLIDDTNSAHKFVTAAEKAKINNTHEWTYTEVIGEYNSTNQAVLLHHQAYDEEGTAILDDIFPFDRTFPVATTTQAGTMSAADKVKLNGIASGAQVNQNAFATVKVGTTSLVADSVSDTLTITAGSNITLTPTASSDSFVIAATDTTYSNATTSTDGLMSASDKTKLNSCVTTTSYATQSTGGVVKMWTTTSGSDTTLHIATQ